MNVISEELSGELTEVWTYGAVSVFVGAHIHYCVQVMEDMLASAEAKSAVLVSTKPGCFIAGADIAWLDSAKDKDEVRLLCLGACSRCASVYVTLLATKCGVMLMLGESNN